MSATTVEGVLLGPGTFAEIINLDALTLGLLGDGLPNVTLNFSGGTDLYFDMSYSMSVI